MDPEDQGRSDDPIDEILAGSEFPERQSYLSAEEIAEYERQRGTQVHRMSQRDMSPDTHLAILAELESINRLLTQLLKMQLPEHPTVEELFGGYRPDA